MSSKHHSSSSLDIVLEKWFKVKEEIATLEKKRDKYKKMLEDKMKSDRISELLGSDYKAKIIKQSRGFLLKKNVPSEIWDKYATNIEYDVMTISKRKKG